jgi:hypothetical protein
MPPRALVPEVGWACNVLKSAAVTRFVGQIIDGGETRKRLQTPPIEKPISWVDMTNSHWSVFAEEGERLSINNGRLRRGRKTLQPKGACWL